MAEPRCETSVSYWLSHRGVRSILRILLCPRPGSNRRPPHYEWGALPTELPGRILGHPVRRTIDRRPGVLVTLPCHGQHDRPDRDSRTRAPSRSRTDVAGLQGRCMATLLSGRSCEPDKSARSRRALSASLTQARGLAPRRRRAQNALGYSFHNWWTSGTPYRIRTGATALKGQRPWPLNERGVILSPSRKHVKAGLRESSLRSVSPACTVTAFSRAVAFRLHLDAGRRGAGGNPHRCPDDRIRTCDPLIPNQVRYQAALHPVNASLRSHRSPTRTRTWNLRLNRAPRCRLRHRGSCSPVLRASEVRSSRTTEGEPERVSSREAPRSCCPPMRSAEAVRSGHGWY